MEISDLIIPTAVSTGIATVVTALFQTYLSNRTAHEFARRLEQHKSELAERLAARSRFIERRLLGYPQLVELSYRARNIARDLTSTRSPALLQEFQAREREIEDAVYKYRIDLERDRLFDVVHDFKNLLVAFSTTASEDHATEPSVAVALRSLYDSIETTYGVLVSRISEEAGGD